MKGWEDETLDSEKISFFSLRKPPTFYDADTSFPEKDARKRLTSAGVVKCWQFSQAEFSELSRVWTQLKGGKICDSHWNLIDNYSRSKINATESVIEIKIEENCTFFQKPPNPIVSWALRSQSSMRGADVYLELWRFVLRRGPEGPNQNFSCFYPVLLFQWNNAK